MSQELVSPSPTPRPMPLDLVHLADTECSLVVRVIGPYGPVGRDSLILEAEVLVSTDFVDARLTTHLLRSDLDKWSQDLTVAEIGKSIGINNDGGRGLSISMFLHEDGSVSIQVMAPDQLWVHCGCQPSGGWIDDHRLRLQAVRQVWRA